jgi:hypothetical protein
MKYRLLLSAAVVSISTFGASYALAAYPVVSVGDKIKFADGNGASPGGAFVLTDWGQTGAAALGSFESFCLEKNEYMDYGGPAYNVGPVFKVDSISTEAKKGGVGGSIGGPGNPHDPLDIKTAFLYTKYIEGQAFLNANVSGWSGASLVDKGTAMQTAIWSIEQEIAAPGALTLAGKLVSYANTFAAGSSWTESGRVKVLNLSWFSGGGNSYPEGTFAQDQLYLQPIPEPETYAMMLAGLGLMGFVARRRKQATKV